MTPVLFPQAQYFISTSLFQDDFCDEQYTHSEKCLASGYESEDPEDDAEERPH